MDYKIVLNKCVLNWEQEHGQGRSEKSQRVLLSPLKYYQEAMFLLLSDKNELTFNLRICP